MSRSKLEYIWLDGSEPTQQMRSKTKVISDFSGKIEDVPTWSFDGSSTNQAKGNSSDLLLKPVRIFTPTSIWVRTKPSGANNVLI